MEFNITGQDYANAGWNDLYVIGFFAAGIAASAAIQKVAHAVFNVQDKTAGSTALRFISFTAVAIVAAYHQPEVALTAFSGDQALQMLLIGAVAAFAVSIITGQKTYIPSVEGALIGYIGNPSLVVSTVFGAAIGSIL